MFDPITSAEVGGISSFIIAATCFLILAGSAHPLDSCSVIELFTNATDPVHLSLGYLGLCISLPDSSINPSTTLANGSSNASSIAAACTQFLRFPTEDPNYALNNLITPHNLMERPSSGYNSSFAALFETAKTFRRSTFEPDLIIAAFTLFVICGLVFGTIFGCQCCRKGKSPGRTTFYSLAGILMIESLSFMLISGATFALVRGQNTIVAVEAAARGFHLGFLGNDTSKAPKKEVFAEISNGLKLLLYGNLAGVSVFICSLVTIFAKYAAHRRTQTYAPVQPQINTYNH